MSAPPDKISELLHPLLSCISDAKAWTTVNIPKLNDNKTELMLVTSKRSKHFHNLPTSITIGNAQIPFKQFVKIFGFTLDCHLTMNAHVSIVPPTCYFEYIMWHLFIDSLQIQKLPHLYLFCYCIVICIFFFSCSIHVDDMQITCGSSNVLTEYTVCISRSQQLFITALSIEVLADHCSFPVASLH